MTKTQQPNVPVHLGVIPDGNRRWAKDNGLVSLEGHRRGLEVARQISLAAFDQGVQYFTMYAFSTENWGRRKTEVNYLMELFHGLVTKEIGQLQERNVRLRVLGRRDRISRRLLEAIEAGEAKTRGNTAGTLALALDYGGQQELADAAASLIREGVAAEAVTPELLAEHLYAADMPPVDLVIRTSGEHRTSNFLLWSAAYAELYFVDKMWPDFTAADLDAAIADYDQRTRRFGR